MAKLLNIPLYLGTLIDNVNKIKGSITSCQFNKREKGLCLDFTSISEINGYGVISGVKTIEFWIKPTGDSKIFLDNGSDKLEINGGNFSGTGLTECTINEVDTDTPTNFIWNHVLAEFSGGIDFSTDFEVDTTANCNIGNIILDDEILSTQQKTDSYTTFFRAKPLSENKRVFEYPKPTDLSYETGLVAAYNMIPSSGGVLVDISGNGNNGDIVGALSTKDGLCFNGVNSDVSFTNPSTLTSWTMVFKVNPRDLSSYNCLISNTLASPLGFREINFQGGSYLGLWSDSAAAEILAAGLQADLYYDIIVTFDGTNGGCYVNGSQTYDSVTDFGSVLSGVHHIGNYRGALQFLYADYGDFKLSSYAFTPQQAKDYHNSFRKPTLLDTYKYIGADGVIKVPIGTELGTGIVKSGETSTGEDYIEFTTAGTTLYKGLDLDIYPNNGHITYDYYNGATWATRNGLVDAPVTGVAYANKTLTFTGTNIGDRIKNINLFNQPLI